MDSAHCLTIQNFEFRKGRPPVALAGMVCAHRASLCELEVEVHLNKLPVWITPSNLESAKTAINDLGRNLHEHCFIVGRILLWVKKEIGHGNFLAWIEQNVWFSQQTASNMMQFTNRCIKKGQLLSYVTHKLPVIGNLNAPINFPGKYHTIVIDPPWAYGNNSGRQKMDYAARTMTPAQVANFDLQRWVADDFCHLYMWVTDAYLGESYAIIRAWGFEPKCSIVWVKDRIGMGNYFRHQHEVCIFALSGNRRLDRRDISTVFTAPITRHSEKPERFYSIVESASVAPYLDVFGRHLRAGWDVYGDEVSRQFQTRLIGSNDSSYLA